MCRGSTESAWMDHFYILDGHEPVRCSDLLTWSRWMRTTDRHVGLTEQGDVSVSTVFLGLDHSLERPALFETMVFIGAHDEGREQYATWDEAEAGHDRWVAKVFKPTPIVQLPEKA